MTRKHMISISARIVERKNGWNAPTAVLICEKGKTMVELKPLTCQNCGGAIDRKTMKCPYCGTQYERKSDGVGIRYVVERPGTHIIRAMAKVDDRMIAQNPEAATKFVMDKMRYKIADALLDYMKMITETEHSPFEQCHIIRGEIRVVNPEFADY